MWDKHVGDRCSSQTCGHGHRRVVLASQPATYLLCFLDADLYRSMLMYIGGDLLAGFLKVCLSTS